jgi:OOP family OmpA-OmpF porin
MKGGQSNSALNGRFMNLSLGLRYQVADRRTNYTTEIVNRVPRIWSADAAIGSHFAGAPLQSNNSLSPTPGQHVAIGLNHPFINPIYFGRFEFAFDGLNPGKSSADFSSKYFRANYFLMTSIQKQLSKSLSSTHVPNRFDVQFGIGAGASTVQSKGHNDYFISKGDDMLNLAVKVVPTYQLSEKVSVFAAYTFVSHSLQSMSYDMNRSVDKTMFNGHLMNASVGLSVTLKSTKTRPFVEVVPVVVPNEVLEVNQEDAPSDTTGTVEPDPIANVTPEPEPEVIPTPADPTRTLINTISDYPVNMSILPASQKEGLKVIAAQLLANPALSLVVSGHADISGSEGYNLALSRNRAANVKAYIISQGVPANRIKIEYYGSTKPVASNETIEGRMKNRRVDIELVTPAVK